MLTLLAPNSAAAQAPNQQPEVTVEVVADGLNVPRGLAYDRLLGRVLVAESGAAAGNNGACEEGFGGSVYCYGETGSIYQYSEHRWLPSTRISTGLPSIWAPDIVDSYHVVLGLHDISLPLGTGIPVGVFGLSGPPSFRDALEASHPRARELATSAWILPGRGNVVPVGDLAEFEGSQNPHPSFLDTDPYGVETSGLKTIVADAAGNTVVEVSATGREKLLAVIPDRITDDGFAEEPVPTTVVKGPDGALYIGELGAAFTPVGFARVWRLAPDGSLSVYADGFTSIVSLTFDHQGRLVVLEMARNGYYQNPLPDGDRTGRLVRVEPDGTQTTLLTEPLENPGGVEAAGPGVFYVTNKSAHLGGEGQLLRVTVTG
ncbi:MAG TPA: ScyD/ScyE family protein [Natronosporangium sp.]